MTKGLLLFHPAGIGDCILDISNIYQLGKQNSENYKLYYVCNVNAKPIVKCTDIEKFADVTYLDYPNKFSYRDMKKMFSIIPYIDMIMIPAGMNLKKISYFKILLPKRIKLYGVLANLPYERVQEIRPLPKSFSYTLGPLKRHRVITNYLLYEKLNLFIDNFTLKGLNKEKLKKNIINKIFIDLTSDYIIIHLGLVNNKNINKTLNMESWTTLIKNVLKNFNLKIVLIGSKSEIQNIKIINGRLGKSEYILDLVGKTNLYESMHLILNSRLVISGDGAIGHITASLGKELICFFGPVNYRDVCPINTRGYVISKILDCSPCYETKNYYSCPFNRSCSNIDVPNIITESIKEILYGNELFDKNIDGYMLRVIPTEDQLKSDLQDITI